MLPDDKKLEIEIGRQLKSLRELQAPSSLLPRVMAVITARAELPWYRRSWMTWPSGPRWASLAALLILFGGLCYFGSGLSEATLGPVTQKFSDKFAGFRSIWNVLNDLTTAIFVAFRHLGTGALIGICATVLLSYAMFLALGAVYVRLAFSPSKSLCL